MSEHSLHPGSCNLVVLAGEVTHDPEPRELAAGVAWQFDIAAIVGGRAEPSARCVVPVNWSQPSDAEIAVVVAGAEVVVIGTVRRRFFRTGGRTVSRTEVIPDRVIPLRRRAAVAKAVAAAAEQISGVGERPAR